MKWPNEELITVAAFMLSPRTQMWSAPMTSFSRITTRQCFSGGMLETKGEGLTRAICLSLGALVVLAGLAYPLNANNPQSKANKVEPVVVIVQRVHGRITYAVDSKPAEDPLRALGVLEEKRGEDCPVMVLLDWRLPISEITDMEFVADKAGFKHVRSFTFVPPGHDYISEIKFGRQVHFAGNFVSDETGGKPLHESGHAP